MKNLNMKNASNTFGERSRRYKIADEEPIMLGNISLDWILSTICISTCFRLYHALSKDEFELPRKQLPMILHLLPNYIRLLKRNICPGKKKLCIRFWCGFTCFDYNASDQSEQFSLRMFVVFKTTMTYHPIRVTLLNTTQIDPLCSIPFLCLH